MSTPFSYIDVKYVPAFLLQRINDRFLIREPEKLYELQFSSLTIPPSIYNFKCYFHLERIRESYGFVIYFVITDSIFYLVPVIISTFSLARFSQGTAFVEGEVGHFVISNNTLVSKVVIKTIPWIKLSHYAPDKKKLDETVTGSDYDIQ